MPVIIIYLVGLKEFKTEEPIYYKIILPSDEFATMPNTTGTWKTEFKFNCESYDADVTFELRTITKKKDKKLSTFRLSLAGHSDTLFENAKTHWYPLSDIKNTKLGLKIGCAPKAKVDDNLEFEIKDSAQRSQRVTEQIITIAGLTNEKLYTQNQKLQRAEANLDQIKQDTVESKREMRSIKSVTGQIQNSLTSSKYTHEPAKPISTRKSHDPVMHFGSKVDQSETDKLVDDISDNVKMIKQAALLMSEQLETEQIDRIQEKTDKSNTDIKKLTSKAKRL